MGDAPILDDADREAEPRAALDLAYVGEYRVAGASVIGRGHTLNGRPRDDAFALVCGGAQRPWWFAAVADGAGSRPLSRHGAAAATTAAAARAREALALGAPPGFAVGAAAWHARLAYEARARALGVAPPELACTLLCVACVLDGGRASVATFQIGDGLIAAVDAHGAIAPLADADDEEPGATLFLDTLPLHAAWPARLRREELAAPRGLFVATDGVADDLMPWAENGPILAAELDAIADDARDAGGRMAELLAYEKRGSFDDRTLVAAWLRRPR